MKYLDQPGQEVQKKLIEVEFITPIYGLVGESSTWEVHTSDLGDSKVGSRAISFPLEALQHGRGLRNRCAGA
jgi:hypothetical protein